MLIKSFTDPLYIYIQSDVSRKTITQARHDISNIIQKIDDRLFIIVGPCSIHDTIAAKEYGKLISI